MLAGVGVPGELDQHRHAHQFLIQRVPVSPATMVVQFLAVVGDEDDQGVFVQPILAEPVHQATEVVVVEGDLAVVSGHGIRHNGRRGLRGDPRGGDRPRQMARIPGVVRRWGRERAVRVHRVHVEEERTALQLAQAAELYDVRLRTTETTDNGRPSLSTPFGSLTADLTHIVYTREASGMARIYVNGEFVVGRIVPGTFANWDAEYRLALADELIGSRTWLGEYYLIAAYGRALSADEIDENYRVGPKTIV